MQLQKIKSRNPVIIELNVGVNKGYSLQYDKE